MLRSALGRSFFVAAVAFWRLLVWLTCLALIAVRVLPPRAVLVPFIEQLQVVNVPKLCEIDVHARKRSADMGIELAPHATE